jgi:histidinol-phosphate phosphatase family protein
VTARRALFLDRDGTLIVDVHYPKDPALVEPIPGAADALRRLQETWVLVVVSNQSGIGRGLITEPQAAAVHERFVAAFAAAGVHFAGFYYCPHVPDAGCACRKPAPGMLHDAARELGLDVARSVMIGDRGSDLGAGRAAGCAQVLRFGPDADGALADARCEEWREVVELLTARTG